MRYVLAGLMASAFVAMLINWVKMSPSRPSEPTYTVSEAKRKAVEPENRVRPASFESMKWTPETELRTPASKSKSEP